MADGIGLAVGAANLRAVLVGRAAVRRSAVLTRYPHRPAEVGVPSENPNLAERGLIITDFVDRVGDPVPIIAPDGSSHRADVVTAEALQALLRTLGGASGVQPVGISYPAHWRQAAVDALRHATAAIPEFRGPVPVTLVSDATAALTALQGDPGLPSRGVIALCDFGATGTSITLADAAQGFAPIAPTVRHEELSGDVVDQALLTHLIADLSAAGSLDVSGTSAIGSLTRLRAQCRAAKERLSGSAVTALTVDLPQANGSPREVRLTRNELDEAIRTPLNAFVGELQDALRRSNVRQGDVVAVASVGGGARIPIITTTLSEHLRVPVITAPQPELAAAIGAGVRAVRGTVVEGATALAPAAPPTRAAVAVPESVDAPRSSTFGALAWSAADDAPEVVEAGDVGERYAEPVPQTARPQLTFDDHDEEPGVVPPIPWYRRTATLLAAALLIAFVALAAVVLFVFRDDPSNEPAGSTTQTTSTTAEPAPAPTSDVPPATASPAPEAPAEPAPRTVTRRQAPPPVVTVTQAPPAPPPSSQEPPPSSPPPPATTEQPPSSTQAPSSQNPFNLPYSTIPGLPFVPAPPGIPMPGQAANP